MFTKRGINQAHVGEDLGRVCDATEEVECFFEVFLIVGLERSSPCLELGFERHLSGNN